MHILLLILKIVGIILLILLGLILLLVFLLIFVPFFYRGEGNYYENKPYAKFQIRYLFPLLQIHLSYKDEKAEGKVKIFGITVYDLFAPQETENAKEEPAQKIKESMNQADGISSTVPDTEQQNPDTETSIAEETDPASNESTVPEPKTFSDKIKHFFKVIKEKLQTILAKLKEWKQKGLQLKSKAEHIVKRLKYYYEVWQMDVTRNAFQKAKRSLLKLWKSVRPKKGSIHLHLGTGDPSGTGQICGFFGMMYPFIGKYVMIEPDFENKIYEGDFFFKGHITIFVLLRVVWLVLFDKDIKELRKILMNENKEDKHE